MNLKFGGVALAVLALASVGCVDRGRQAQAKKTTELVSNPTRPVSTQPIQFKTVSETLAITGQVTTSEDTMIGAKRSGRLVSVAVRDGDAVKAGQVIATLDASDAQAQMRQALAALSGAQSQLAQAKINAAIAPSKSSAAVASAQAQLRSAKAQLKKAQAGARPQERIQVDWQVKSAKTNMDTAQAEYDRTQKLVAQGAIAASRLDQAQNALMAAQTQYNAALQNQALIKQGTRSEDLMVAQEAVRAAQEAVRQAQANKQLDAIMTTQVMTAQAQVQAAQSQLDIARQALSDTMIRAPFSGRVAGKPMQPGTVVSPGQTIVRLIGSSGLYFEGDVPESQVSIVQPGKAATVKIDALPSQTFTGKVLALSPVGQDVGRQFRARVQINGDLSAVRPGMFASGDILIRSVSGIVVPASAVVQRDGKPVVFVVDGKKARQVAVTVGLRQGNDVQVTGLVNGQMIVVRGQEDLVDGSAVEVESVPQQVADARPRRSGE